MQRFKYKNPNQVQNVKLKIQFCECTNSKYIMMVLNYKTRNKNIVLDDKPLFNIKRTTKQVFGAIK